MTKHYCDAQGRYAGAFDGDHGLDLSHLTEVSAPEHGLDTWNAVTGLWERVPEVHQQTIKQQCSAVILSRVNEKDQRNLTALALRHMKRERGGGGKPPRPKPEADAQLNLIDDIFDWIQAMKEESRRSIVAGDDPIWPAWNDAWNELVELV